MKTSHLIVILVSIAVAGLLFFLLYLSGSSLLLSVAGTPSSDTPAATAGLVGNRLPYFDLPTLAGDRAGSGDFTDTPLVIVFWSTWNGEAADEIHILDQYLASEPSQDALVKVLAIDSQEERSIVASFMSRGGYQVETLLDQQGRTSEAYGIKSLPTFYFVDRTGIVREVYSGALSQTALMNKIENILQ